MTKLVKLSGTLEEVKAAREALYKATEEVMGEMISEALKRFADETKAPQSRAQVQEEAPQLRNVQDAQDEGL